MKRELLKTEDFKLSFETVTWGEEIRIGFPVIRWPNGTLVEPTALYFGFSLQERMGVGISSLRPEAYALREWLVYLCNQRLRWDRVDDYILARWRESHRTAIERSEIHEHQVERKLHIVYTFYRLLQIGLPYDHKGQLRPLLVAPRPHDRGFPISTALTTSRRGKETFIWGQSKKVAPKRTRRPTPDDKAVQRVLDWIRSAPDRTARNSSPSKKEREYLRSERDWLLARTQSESGFRRSDAAAFLLAHVYDTLRDEGIILPRGPTSLMNLTEAERLIIDQGLSALEAKRKYIYVRVEGKGKKVRYAAMSLALFRDIIDIGISRVRKRQVQIWMGAGKNSRSNAVFLSFETRSALTSGAVGDIVKRAFTESGVAGSGHRLRAHYCTFMAISLWEEAMSANGFVYTQALETTVLHRLAESMGHENVTTSVRYYLDLAMLQYFGFRNKQKYKFFRAVWQELSAVVERLNSRDVNLIVGMIGALARAPNAKLQDVLTLVLQNPELNPGGFKEAQPRQKPKLKLVE